VLYYIYGGWKVEKEIDYLQTVIAVLMAKHTSILTCTTAEEARQIAESALYVANKLEEMHKNARRV
jgi:hypothetical protein